MNVDRSQDFIDRMRSADIHGLCSGSFARVHKSMLNIAKMRLSIERAHLQVGRSRKAVFDSKTLLERLRLKGF